ncbi:MAG: hypothetical protein V4671_09685 [Armatimonadota bacterium]
MTLTADNMTTAKNRAIIAPTEAVNLLATLTDADAPASVQDAPTEAPEAPERDRFHITDRNGLEWYSRKLANIRAERESIKAQAAKMVAALDADETGLKHLYEEEAKATTAALLAAGGNRRKSVDTFFGSFGFRTQPGRYAVTDRDAALPHAQALGCVKVEITVEAYLQAAEAKLLETGELLPGIAKTDDAEVFGLSLPRKKKGGIITTADLDGE